ncbi:hypothetical protein Hanom_Chr04g00362171 [Helianthus anomalus]
MLQKPATKEIEGQSNRDLNDILTFGQRNKSLLNIAVIPFRSTVVEHEHVTVKHRR